MDYVIEQDIFNFYIDLKDRSAGSIYIEVTDDGQGIDYEKQIAKKYGLKKNIGLKND
ncbi:MAG: hypothetical protein HWN80_03495 [Candidatus Lokiarchaeota archaeon]|nr:hypothetical protein [Candidatus Lokiarchaeota archaeon]